MKTRRRLFRFHSIRSRIIASFSTFLVFFACCIAGLVIHIFSAQMLEAQQNAAMELASRTAGAADAALREIEAGMNGIIYSKTVTDTLAGYPDAGQYRRFTGFLSVQEVLKGVVMQREDLAAAYLFDESTLFCYLERSYIINRESLFFTEMAKVAQKGGGCYYTGVYTPDYYDRTGRSRVFTMMKPVVDVQNGAYRRLGVLTVNVSDVFFEKISGFGSLGEKRELYVLDDKGMVLYYSRGELSPRALQRDKGWEEPLAFINTGEDGARIIDGRLYACCSSARNGWRYVVTDGFSELNHSMHSTRVTIIALILVGVAITILFAALITARATGSVGGLARYMGEIARGNLDVRIENKASCGEMDALYVGLRQMAGQLKTLINDNYLKELREQQAKLESLQAQISPHFFYNTLQMISSLAVLGRCEDIEWVTGRLADFFAYVLYEKGTVCLYQELEHVQNYVDIQNVRYNQKFRLRLKIPKELESMRISKLLLQPLVENAILHGFEQEEGECLMEISAQKEEGKIRFVLYDNGMGIRPDELHRLNETLARRGRREGGSIGLSNVEERIRLMYGDGYGLRIESVYGEYTRVILEIPAEAGGEGC